MEAILAWLVKKILEVILSRLVSFIQEKAEQIKKEKERGEINEANTKAYDEALGRKSRVDAALRLLNGAKVSDFKIS